MVKTDAPLFGRVVTAMATPFTDALAIDYKAVERLVDHLVRTGTDSIVVAGTTGESPTLDEAEKKDLLKAVLSAARGRARVIMGTGSNATDKTVRASQAAEAAGADGLLVVAPYYNKPSQEGLLAHFQAVARATSLPLILYNIPGRTGINVSVETILELAGEYPSIHAVKDSTGNVDQAGDIAGKAPDSFRIYSGDDNMTLPFLSVGACGVVSVASHLVGEPIAEMVREFHRGEVARAREIHCRFLPLFKGLFIAPNPTCVKYALSRLGLMGPHVRLPLVEPTRAQKEQIDMLIRALDICAKSTPA